MSYLTDLKATHQLEINLIKDLASFKSGMVFISGNDQSLSVGCSHYLMKLDQSRDRGFIYEIVIPSLNKLFKDLTRDNVKSYQMRVVGKLKDFRTDMTTPNIDEVLLNANKKTVPLKLTNYIYNIDERVRDGVMACILKPLELNAVNHDHRYLISNKFFKDIMPFEFNAHYKIRSNEPSSYGDMFSVINNIKDIQIVLTGLRKPNTMEVL
jgi:hypothetical protein